MLFLCNIIIANVAQRTFEIVQKSRSHEQGRYNYMDKKERRLRTRASPETSTWEVPCDVSRKLQLTLCAIVAA